MINNMSNLLIKKGVEFRKILNLLERDAATKIKSDIWGWTQCHHGYKHIVRDLAIEVGSIQKAIKLIHSRLN